jgi:hypothetical protein
MHVFHAAAAWLYANVLGNLVASAIWGIPAGAGFVWHHRALRRHHAAELRKVRDQHTEDLRKLRVHLLGAISEQRQEQRQEGDR